MQLRFVEFVDVRHVATSFSVEFMFESIFRTSAIVGDEDEALASSALVSAFEFGEFWFFSDFLVAGMFGL